MKINNKISNQKDIWVISKGRPTDFIVSGIGNETRGVLALEYDISDIGKYLLNPNPIEIEKKLLGCDVYFYQAPLNRLKEKIRRIMFRRRNQPDQHKVTFLSGANRKSYSAQDAFLEAYLDQFKAQLKPYDPVLKGLTSIDTNEISNIVGICEEDIEGNRSWLNLKGSISEKIDYVCRNLGEKVKVILEKSHIADSLFELRGFDFTSFNPKRSHRLIKLQHGGETRVCVVDNNDRIDFWVEDLTLFQYMHLLDQSIKANPNFAESFRSCVQGQAKPLRLLFNRKIEIDYSKARLPKAYREVFDSVDIPVHGTDRFMNSLKNLQFGISFQCIPRSGTGRERLFTNISVLHDLRALDPIKKDLPQLYSEINKRASVSEAGKFYVLDSIKGFKNE